MSNVLLATLEATKRALDVASTARSDDQVRRALESATDAVTALTHRSFVPQVATRYFDWPNRQYARAWRLWLDVDELISVTTLTAGGTVIGSSDYFLEPVNSGPPYTHVEIDLSSTSAFAPGATFQRAIQIDGVFGYSADTDPAGALAEALDASETGVDVTDSAVVGTGTIVKVDDERMIVTARQALDTGQTSSALTASSSDDSVTGITAGTISSGEVLLVDSERMLVVDVAGTTLTVKRAWDGSVLTAHSAGTTIFAPRTLQVERGALGTTAATHLTATAVVSHVIPPLVRDLAIAEAINQLQQETSGYARVVGEGDNAREGTGRSLFDLRRDVERRYGRRVRTRAV